MVTSLKKFSVRYVQIPAELAKVLGRMAINLQTESIVGTWRKDNRVSGEASKAYESPDSGDNGRN